MARDPREFGGIYLEPKGPKDVVANLQALAAQFPAFAGLAMHAEYTREVEEIRRVTPFDTDPPRSDRGGQLQESVRVIGPVNADRGIEIVVAAGGDEVKYAIKQHQLDYEHERGERFYIESVLEESQQHMAARITRRLEASMEATVTRGA